MTMAETAAKPIHAPMLVLAPYGVSGSREPFLDDGTSRGNRGLLLGALVGGLVGYEAGRKEEYGGAIIGSIIGAAVGATVGWVVGRLTAPD